MQAMQTESIHIPFDDTAVVVAAYNEETVIADVLDDLRRPGFQCVVVDDGSSDRTAEIAAQHADHVLRHRLNAGQGAALRTGIEYALRSLPGQYVATFDADGQHRVEDLKTMVTAIRLGASDVVLGSRFLAGGEAPGIPRLRRLMLKTAVRFTRRTTHLDVTDTHNGLRVFTREAASQLRLQEPGMGHATEVLEQCALLHLKVEEVPTTVQYTEYSRRKGQGAINSISLLFDWFLGRMR